MGERIQDIMKSKLLCIVLCAVALVIALATDSFAGVKGRPGMVRDGHYVKPQWQSVSVETFTDTIQIEVPTGGVWRSVGYGAGGTGHDYSYGGNAGFSNWSNSYSGYTTYYSFPMTQTIILTQPVIVETLRRVW